MLSLKENIGVIQRKKKQSFLLENGHFKVKKPKERVTDSNRSTKGYTFLSNINFSINKTHKKDFRNLKIIMLIKLKPKNYYVDLAKIYCKPIRS